MYGELFIPPVYEGRNLKTGRYMKGHIPANKGKNGASTCQRELSDVVPKDGRISTCIEIKTADLSTQAVVAGRWWQSWTMVRSGYSHLSLLLLNT